MISAIFLILFCSQRETSVDSNYYPTFNSTLENDSLVVRSNDQDIFGAVNFGHDVECTITDSLFTIKSLWTNELVHTKEFTVTRKEHVPDRINKNNE